MNFTNSIPEHYTKFSTFNNTIEIIFSNNESLKFKSNNNIITEKKK